MMQKIRCDIFGNNCKRKGQGKDKLHNYFSVRTWRWVSIFVRTEKGN